MGEGFDAGSLLIGGALGVGAGMLYAGKRMGSDDGGEGGEEPSGGNWPGRYRETEEEEGEWGYNRQLRNGSGYR